MDRRCVPLVSNGIAMTDKPSRGEAIAGALLDIGAVMLRPGEPFTWASGLKSPIYCDNRLILGYPNIREQTTAGFVECFQKNRLNPDVIAGTATAGIPHAAWLAHELHLPMIYVRSKPKEHGRGNQIEGPVEPGQTAVVIEDLVSTGKSSIAAVDALQKAGLEVQGVVAIFSYGFDAATRAFEENQVPYFALSNYETLTRVAAERGSLSPEDLASLEAWRADPDGWVAG